MKKFFFFLLEESFTCSRQVQCSKDRSFHLAVNIERNLEICRDHAGRNGGRERKKESGDTYECSRVSRARLTTQNRVSVISKCFRFGYDKSYNKTSQVPVS